MFIYSVSQVTQHIKLLLEIDDLLADIWVAGEVSNFSRPASGHVYFTLKDDQAALRCVIWRSQANRLPSLPRDGEAVIVHGHISVYEPQGVYQLQVDAMQPEGLGLLHLEFEALKSRLEAEGLFDAARKRPLPPFPQRIGVVTSPTGAVLHDILNILRRRYPLAEIILAPTAVQGLEAPSQIVAALSALNSLGNIDVIIVARGGGSLEELWAFNDEQVARAIAASTVPVISAIGHETDFTIADFVADLRAPTPSAAAELVAPDVTRLREQVTAWQERLSQQMERLLSERRSVLEQETRLLSRLSPMQLVTRQRQHVDELLRVASHRLENILSIRRERMLGLEARLSALNPLATLERGYAIVSLMPEGPVVHSVGQVAEGQLVNVRVSDGSFAARVS